MFRNQSGQLSLTAVAIIAGATLTIVGGFIGFTYKVDSQIDNVAAQADKKISDLETKEDIKIGDLTKSTSKTERNIVRICTAFKIKCEE